MGEDLNKGWGYMKKKIFIALLIISLGLNLYILGKWLVVEQWYEPSPEENVILSEMIQKTVKSEDYKKLEEKENIIAIDAGIDKNKGGVFPYYFGVSVRTDEQTYLFSCNNDQCSKMEIGGWTYSIYEDESPRLPFRNRE